jgi:hypothetical protein
MQLTQTAGFTNTCAAAKVVDTGKFRESTARTSPYPVLNHGAMERSEKENFTRESPLLPAAARRSCSSVPGTFSYILDKRLPIVIERSDSRVAAEHNRPLAGVVPVQFAHAARGEPHY